MILPLILTEDKYNVKIGNIKQCKNDNSYWAWVDLPENQLIRGSPLERDDIENNEVYLEDFIRRRVYANEHLLCQEICLDKSDKNDFDEILLCTKLHQMIVMGNFYVSNTILSPYGQDKIIRKIYYYWLSKASEVSKDNIPPPTFKENCDFKIIESWKQCDIKSILWSQQSCLEK